MGAVAVVSRGGGEGFMAADEAENVFADFAFMASAPGPPYN